jgi:hypothetical protein
LEGTLSPHLFARNRSGTRPENPHEMLKSAHELRQAFRPIYFDG